MFRSRRKGINSIKNHYDNFIYGYKADCSDSRRKRINITWEERSLLLQQPALQAQLHCSGFQTGFTFDLQRNKAKH